MSCGCLFVDKLLMTCCLLFNLPLRCNGAQTLLLDLMLNVKALSRLEQVFFTLAYLAFLLLLRLRKNAHLQQEHPDRVLCQLVHALLDDQPLRPARRPWVRHACLVVFVVLQLRQLQELQGMAWRRNLGLIIILAHAGGKACLT